MLANLIDYTSPQWESLPGDVRREVRARVETFAAAPSNDIAKWFNVAAEKLSISPSRARTLYYEWKNSGQEWHVLADGRKSSISRATSARARNPQFAAFLLKLVEDHQRKSRTAFKTLRARWKARTQPIPGYETYPGWPKMPAGWTDRNLYRIVNTAQENARLRSIRVGTSSKTNPFLPTVLTTRAGLWPGAVIQLDDVFHDNIVTLGKKREPVRVMELGALDLYSACRFHFGAKPRRRTEAGGWENIRLTDMRMFLAGMFHTHGYSPRGTMLMSEHATAKVSEDIARTLYDATHGLIRVEYQPIEGKQAALSGYWSGTEGGNFRAKACLESTHNLMHNDLSALPMQTGSPSSGLAGPVTTDRQLQYIERILKSIAAKAPHRIDLLRLPTLDFHAQFYPFLVDYYELGLNARTDHDLEGWETLGHVINEYTLAPGSGHYLPEHELAALPEPSQLAIRHAARQDPSAWSRRRNLSPAEVWNRREKFLPIPPVVICDILGQDLAREATARRGFIEFSDNEIAAEKLIYTSRYISGPNVGREIPHGEKVRIFVMPFDSGTAIVTDAQEKFLGEIPLYQRVTPINESAFHTDAPFEQRPDIRSVELTRAAGEKHSRIADILEPARIRHAHKVADAKDLREHNRRLINGDPITPDEISAARSASADRAVTTRREREWSGEIDATATAAALQTTAAENPIDDNQIAAWLND